MKKLSRHQKTGLNCFGYPAHLNSIPISRKSTQNTTIYILILKLTSLDIGVFFARKCYYICLPVSKYID